MRILFLISILITSSLFAQSELPMLIQTFAESQNNGLGKLANQCTEADFQKCATELCGSASAHQKKTQEMDPLKAYDEKKFGKTEDIKKKIRSLIEARRVINENALIASKENFSSLTKSWIDFEWDIHVSDAILPDLDISYDEKKDLLLVSPKKGITGSEEYKAWLSEFSITNANNYIRSLKKLPSQGSEKIRLCQDPECRNIMKDKLQSFFNKVIDEFIKKNNDPTLINDLTTKCLSNYIHTSVEQDKINEFKKLLPEVKKVFVEKGMEKFSKHSRKQFKKYLDNELHFAFDYDQVPPAKKLLNDSKKIDKTILEQSMLSDVVRFKSPDSFNPYSEIPVCVSYSETLFDNAYLELGHSDKSYDEEFSRKDKITVSMSTCRFHEPGKFVVAHELGHALSRVFSREKLSSSSLKDFRKIRECASTASPLKDPSRLNWHPHDIMTTEEDTADLIAFKTMRGQKEVASCNLLTSDGTKYFQANLELDLAPIKNEEHSSPLVRLIREAIYKLEKIPVDCEPVVEEYRQMYKDQKLCI